MGMNKFEKTGEVFTQTQTDLTHAVGTADGTVADVTGSFSQTVLNNNFKELTVQLALLKTDVANLMDQLNKANGGGS